MNSPTQESFTGANTGATVTPAQQSSSHEKQYGELLRRQEAIVVMGRRALNPPELPILMQDAAALVAEMLDAEFSGVAQLSADGRSLQLRLAPADNGSSEDVAINDKTDASGSDSLAGYALEAAHALVVDDLAAEKRFTDRFLRRQGIVSAVVVPLTLQNRSFGSLAAYSRQPHHFDEEGLLFIETIAHLLATTIARTKAEESLADQRRLASGVLETVDAIVLMLDSRCNIVQANSACQRVTGFSEAEIKDRPIWNVLTVPEEVGVFQQLPKKLKDATSPVRCESDLLTKHSKRRCIAWSFSMTADADGEPKSVIATGVDITEQREAEQRATKAEEVAEKARQSLRRIADADSGSEDVLQASRPFGELPQPPNVERRKRPRRSYPYLQKIAPVIGGKLPDQDDFGNVQCNDIAAGGFAYFSDSAPPSDILVVALGVPPKVTYLTGKVAHSTKIRRNGRDQFVIGCNYTGRAVY